MIKSLASSWWGHSQRSQAVITHLVLTLGSSSTQNHPESAFTKERTFLLRSWQVGYMMSFPIILSRGFGQTFLEPRFPKRRLRSVKSKMEHKHRLTSLLMVGMSKTERNASTRAEWEWVLQLWTRNCKIHSHSVLVDAFCFVVDMPTVESEVNLCLCSIVLFTERSLRSGNLGSKNVSPKPWLRNIGNDIM